MNNIEDNIEDHKLDKEAVEEYMKDVEILEKEGLFTDHNTVIEDWKDD